MSMMQILFGIIDNIGFNFLCGFFLAKQLLPRFS